MRVARHPQELSTLCLSSRVRLANTHCGQSLAAVNKVKQRRGPSKYIACLPGVPRPTELAVTDGRLFTKALPHLQVGSIGQPELLSI
ncbi:hypothetical protein FA13DRAFT_1733818 [Coprinellus micaceus]|uniref:Uncharacterized protein n=1 Tax=Coprinellus micaceus TaxID=71717 RepID=A0A4Y7T934_COPMI|nr:hypothetical protein FA13DRAFT_1733818 [Coprinellus micaceus]